MSSTSSLIEKGFAEGAKALILCNPSNPCGKVFRRDELEAIAKLAHEVRRLCRHR